MHLVPVFFSFQIFKSFFFADLMWKVNIPIDRRTTSIAMPSRSQTITHAGAAIFRRAISLAKEWVFGISWIQWCPWARRWSAGNMFVAILNFKLILGAVLQSWNVCMLIFLRCVNWFLSLCPSTVHQGFILHRITVFFNRSKPSKNKWNIFPKSIPNAHDAFLFIPNVLCFGEVFLSWFDNETVYSEFEYHNSEFFSVKGLKEKGCIPCICGVFLHQHNNTLEKRE